MGQRLVVSPANLPFWFSLDPELDDPGLRLHWIVLGGAPPRRISTFLRIVPPDVVALDIVLVIEVIEHTRQDAHGDIPDC